MAAFPHLFADGTVLPAAGFTADQQFELQFDGDRRRGYVKEGENRFSQEWDAHYGNPPDPVLL